MSPASKTGKAASNTTASNPASKLKKTDHVFLDDGRVCDRVTLESWQRRGIGHRTMEIAASFLEEQA